MGIFRPISLPPLTEENTLPAGDVSYSEMVDTSQQYQFYLGRSDSKANAFTEVWKDRIDEVERLTGIKLNNPGERYSPTNIVMPDVPDSQQFFDNADQRSNFADLERQKQYDLDVAEFEKTIGIYSQHFPQDSKVFQSNAQQINDEVLARIEEALSNRQYVNERTSPNILSTDTAVKFYGDFTGNFTDPINLSAAALSIYSPARTLIQRGLIDGMIGGGAEAIIQKDVQKWFKEVGIPYTDETYWENVRLGVYTNIVLGQAFDVGGRAIKLTTKQMINGIRAFRKAHAAKNGKTNIPDDQDIKDFDNQSDVDEIINSRSVLKNDPDHQLHHANLETATKAVLEGDMDAVPKLTADQITKVNELIDENNIQTQVFDPDDIQIDAKRFQFKSGGDAKGKIGTLEGVEKWEDYKSNVLLVYKDLNGNHFVADGHQRVNLAKELKGKGQKPKLVSYVINEADGWDPVMARAYAARKNLAEGNADVFDAARALQIDPKALDNFPSRSKFAEFTQGISKLDPNVFLQAEQSGVKVSYLSMVGRYFDDPKQQLNAVQMLKRIEPSNELKARSILEQMKEAGFLTKKDFQAGLFGDEDIIENLFIERADILDATIKLVDSEKRIFNSLVENSPFIEKYGNKLDNTTNLQRRDLNAEISETIKQNANIKGEISDLLTDIARRYNAGELKLRDATNEFLQEIGDRFRSDRFRRIGPGTARISDDIAEVLSESRQPKNTIREGKLEKYSNPEDFDTDTLELQANDLFEQMTELDPDFANSIAVDEGVTFRELNDDFARDKRILKELDEC